MMKNGGKRRGNHIYIYIIKYFKTCVLSLKTCVFNLSQ